MNKLTTFIFITLAIIISIILPFLTIINHPLSPYLTFAVGILGITVGIIFILKLGDKE